MPDQLFDGVVTVSDDSDEMAEASEMSGTVFDVVGGPSFPGNDRFLGKEGTDRTVVGGRSARLAQGLVVPAR